MRVGQLIGAGSGKNVSLFCVIKKIDSQQIEGEVINGAWRITFRPNETICHAPSGDDVINAKILYTGDLPKHLRFEYYCTDTYTEALEFMNTRMNSHVPMWAYGLIGNVKVRVARLTNALSAGKQAFKEAWNPPRRVDEYNDDIPF